MCLCFGCGGVGWCRWRVGRGLGTGVGSGGGGVMSCVRCESGLSVWMAGPRYLCIVLGGYLHI